jgi:hypothetical protein
MNLFIVLFAFVFAVLQITAQNVTKTNLLTLTPPSSELKLKIVKDVLTVNWNATAIELPAFKYNKRYGDIEIKKPGLYLIIGNFAIHGLERRWSFVLQINKEERAKCIASEQLRTDDNLHPTAHGVFKSCTFSYLAVLKKNDRIEVYYPYEGTHLIKAPGFNYFQIAKL